MEPAWSSVTRFTISDFIICLICAFFFYIIIYFAGYRSPYLRRFFRHRFTRDHTHTHYTTIYILSVIVRDLTFFDEAAYRIGSVFTGRACSNTASNCDPDHSGDHAIF